MLQHVCISIFLWQKVWISLHILQCFYPLVLIWIFIYFFKLIIQLCHCCNTELKSVQYFPRCSIVLRCTLVFVQVTTWTTTTSIIYTSADWSNINQYPFLHTNLSPVLKPDLKKGFITWVRNIFNFHVSLKRQRERERVHKHVWYLRNTLKAVL
jgi:hypothetical protein